MARWWWLGAVLAGAACHKDICERDEKVDVACGLAHTSDQTRACKDALKGCSADDQDALDAYQDCKDKVGGTACEPTPQAYIDVLGCLDALELSEQCQPQLVGSGS